MLATNRKTWIGQYTCVIIPVRNIRCRCLMNLACRSTRQSRSGAWRDGVSQSWYDRISTMCLFSYSLRISNSFKASGLSLEMTQKQAVLTVQSNYFTQIPFSVLPLGKQKRCLCFQTLKGLVSNLLCSLSFLCDLKCTLHLQGLWGELSCSMYSRISWSFSKNRKNALLKRVLS